MRKPTVGLLRGPRTLSIMPTFACPASCQDCGTRSSPDERTVVDLPTILDTINQAKDLGFANVVFTGGEATLRWHDLLAAIRHARSLALPTRLVTNAHWATSSQAAHKRVQTLVEAGLDEINFSTGDQHIRFVPIDRVALGIAAALQFGFEVYVMIELKLQRSVTKVDLLNHPTIRSLTAPEREKIEITESPWMPLDPRVTELYPNDIVANRQNIRGSSGCTSILQTYVLQADGRIGSCCGLGMRLVPELSTALADQPGFLERAINDAEDDLLKLWLKFEGPNRILEWAATKDPGVDWENRYGHQCQACMRIFNDAELRRVIEDHGHEVVGHILQCAWLQERFIPDRVGVDLPSSTANP